MRSGKMFFLICLIICLTGFFSLLPAQESYNIQKTGEIFNFWSSIQDIAIEDTMAIISAYAGLFFLDISDPSEPVLMKQFSDVHGGQIKIHGNFVYSYLNTLNICDITDISNPTLCCEFSAESDIKYLDFYNELVVIQKADSTLSVVDFSNFNSPELLGSHHLNGDAGDFAIHGNLLFIQVVTEEVGPAIKILDIANPEAISQFGSISFTNDEYEINGSSILIYDDIIYITWETDFFIYDISDPQSPALLSTMTVPEASYKTLSPQGDYLFSSCDSLIIHDISDPTNPYFLTSYIIPDSLYNDLPRINRLIPHIISVGNNIMGLSVARNLMDDYFSDLFVLFFDINDLPYMEGNLYTEYWESISDLKINGDFLYSSGVKQRIVDISDLENYEEMGAISKHFEDIEVNSNFLFGYTYQRINDEYIDSLYFYDITNRNSPFVVNSFDISMDHNVELAASEEYLVVSRCDYDNSDILVYDVTNPSETGEYLIRQGFPDPGYSVDDAAIIGNYIYVVGNFRDYDIQVFEIFGTGDSRYLAIRNEISICDDISYYNICIEDEHIITRGYSSYAVLNIDDRINPYVTYIDTETSSYDIACRDNHVFLSTGSGLEIVDITDPEDIWISGYYYYPYRYGFKFDINTESIFIPYSNHIDIFNYSPSMSIEALYSDVAPTNYELVKAYPNPFNPTLNIRVSLPETGVLKLTVHNVLGQEVVKLADRTFERGYHNFTLDGSKLSSGVYFVKAVVEGKMNDVQKVMLMK